MAIYKCGLVWDGSMMNQTLLHYRNELFSFLQAKGVQYSLDVELNDLYIVNINGYSGGEITFKFDLFHGEPMIFYEGYDVEFTKPLTEGSFLEALRETEKAIQSGYIIEICNEKDETLWKISGIRANLPTDEEMFTFSYDAVCSSAEINTLKNLKLRLLTFCGLVKKIPFILPKKHDIKE